jgi:hypothetical protein
MKTDVQAFFRELCLNRVTESPFFDVPVLAAIEPAVFVDHLLSLPPLSQNSVFSMFKGRYEGGALNSDLQPEQSWLAEVKKILEMRMASLRPMSRYRLKHRIGHSLDPFLKSI